MTYGAFARWYDALNGDADYDALARQIETILCTHGIADGIVADLGCGTGELSLRLAARGYDMIAVDRSPDMLGIFREKAENQGHGEVLLLCQPLEALDLFGTIRAGVSTFDTFNHLAPAALQKALRRIALFTEPGGLLVFDVNTPYKHREVLANNTFEAFAEDGSGVSCEWQNRHRPDENATDIELTVWQGETPLFCEEFTEYYYTIGSIRKMLHAAGFCMEGCIDGESFEKSNNHSQRWLITATRNKSDSTP